MVGSKHSQVVVAGETIYNEENEDGKVTPILCSDSRNHGSLSTCRDHTRWSPLVRSNQYGSWPLRVGPLPRGPTEWCGQWKHLCQPRSDSFGYHCRQRVSPSTDPSSHGSICSLCLCAQGGVLTPASVLAINQQVTANQGVLAPVINLVGGLSGAITTITANALPLVSTTTPYTISD